MNKSTRQRNSVIELIRILCILMVIAGHYCAHGVSYALGPLNLEIITPRLLFLQMITFGADIANDMFIIITGYYMINSSMKGKRILKVFGEMIFYAVLIALTFHFTELKVLSGEAFKKLLLPFWSGENWFVTCYLLLCLLIPFLNSFLKNLDQRSFAKLLVILFLLRFVTPLLHTKTFWNTAHGLEQFIFLYFIGAYIKLHGFQTKLLQNKWFWRVLLLVAAMLFVALNIGLATMGIRTQNQELISEIKKYYPIFSVLISSIVLVVALGLPPFYSKFINLISGSVLGIYLIHDNSLVREYIWRTISPNIDQIGSNHIFIHMGKKVLLVFVACVIIDQVRLWLLEKPIEKILKKNR